MKRANEMAEKEITLRRIYFKSNERGIGKKTTIL